MAEQDYGGLTFAVNPNETVEKTATVLPPSSVMTALPDVYMPPDLTVQCVLCAAYIHMHAVPEHRAFHDALNNLHFDTEIPSTSKTLMESRQEKMLNLLREANSEHPVDPWRVNIMDDSYEILKSYMEETFDNLRMVKPDSEPQATSELLDTNCRCVCSASVCTDMNGDLRDSMEDAHVFIGDFEGSQGDPTSIFLGVYDGHNGRYAVEKAQSDIQTHLEKHLKNTTAQAEDLPLDSNDSDLKIRKGGMIYFAKDALYRRYADAFRHAYVNVDEDVALAEDESSRVRWSGCSALSAIIETSSNFSKRKDTEQPPSPSLNDFNNAAEIGRIYLANAGDVRAVVCKQGKTYRISQDHTTDNKQEASRVMKAGGDIIGSKKSSYVYGIMPTTRGIGNHGDQRIRKCVLPVPRTASIVLDEQMEFIVIATKGVWSVFSDEEVVALMAQFLPKYHHNPLPLSRSLSRKLSVISDGGGDASSIVAKSNLKVDKKQRPITATSALSVTWEDQHEDGVSVDRVNDNADNSIVEEIAVNKEEGLTKERLELHNEKSNKIELTIPRIDNLNQHSSDRSKSYSSIPFSFPGSMNFHSAEEISRRMSERLVQSAILAGSNENVTVMIILLPGWET